MRAYTDTADTSAFFTSFPVLCTSFSFSKHSPGALSSSLDNLFRFIASAFQSTSSSFFHRNHCYYHHTVLHQLYPDLIYLLEALCLFGFFPVLLSCYQLLSQKSYRHLELISLSVFVFFFLPIYIN